MTLRTTHRCSRRSIVHRPSSQTVAPQCAGRTDRCMRERQPHPSPQRLLRRGLLRVRCEARFRWHRSRRRQLCHGRSWSQCRWSGRCDALAVGVVAALRRTGRGTRAVRLVTTVLLDQQSWPEATLTSENDKSLASLFTPGSVRLARSFRERVAPVPR